MNEAQTEASASKTKRRLKVVADMGFRSSGAFLQVLVAALIAKWVPIEEAGRYFLVFTAVTVLSVLLRAGFDQTVIRLTAAAIATGKVDEAREVGRHFMGRLIARSAWLVTAAVGGLIAVATQKGTGPEGQRLILEAGLFVSACVMMAAAGLGGASLQAFRRSLASVGVSFYATNGCLLAVLLVSPAGSVTAHGLLIALTVGAVIGGYAGGVFLMPKSAPDLADWRESPPEYQAADESARSNALSVVGNLYLMWGPLLTLGWLGSAEDSAQYAVSNRLSQLIVFLLPALNFAVGPRFSALMARGEHRQLKKALWTSIIASTIVSTLVAIPMGLGAEWGMERLGSDYAAAGSVFVTLIFSQWVAGSAGPVLQFLTMIGEERLLRSIFGASSLVLAVVSIPMIELYGALGAALATLAGTATLNSLALAYSISRAQRLVAPTRQPS